MYTGRFLWFSTRNSRKRSHRNSLLSYSALRVSGHWNCTQSGEIAFGFCVLFVVECITFLILEVVCFCNFRTFHKNSSTCCNKLNMSRMRNFTLKWSVHEVVIAFYCSPRAHEHTQGRIMTPSKLVTKVLFSSARAFRRLMHVQYLQAVCWAGAMLDLQWRFHFRGRARVWGNRFVNWTHNRRVHSRVHRCVLDRIRCCACRCSHHCVTGQLSVLSPSRSENCL